MTKRILGSIWFWWILLTLIYIPLYLKYLDVGHIETTGGHVAGFFGLFVPFGLLGLTWAMITLPFASISIALCLAGAYFFQKWLSKKNFNLFIDIVLILAVLFVLTFISDLLRGTGIFSWDTFINGHLPSFS